MKTLLCSLALLLLAVDANAQCGAGGCGSGGGAGFSRGMGFSPMQYSYSEVSAQWEPPYTGPDGRIYEKWTDGTWRARISDTAAHPCVCGCVATGKCVCPNCNVGCGIVAAKVASNCPECDAAKAMVRAKDLRQVQPPDGSAFYQTPSGNIVLANVAEVEAMKKLDGMVSPVTSWTFVGLAK